MRFLIKYIFIVIGSLLLFPLNGVTADKIPVFVSIVPQKYFVQQIGKNLVDVRVMVKPGANPATYEPKPRQMADLSKAKIYFAIGVPFENTWLKKIAAANPKMKVIHTEHGIKKRPVAAHDHTDETHHHGKNAHGILDPHIWLSPPLVKIQARRILNGLLEIDPAHRNIYEANYKQFEAGIDRLDADIKKIFMGRRGLRFMVFHPAWGYFAHTYGLEQVPIEIEGKTPKPAQLKKLIEHARRSKIRVVFVQPQFSAKSARLIAGEIGGRITFADPLAEDWKANLYEVADNFKAALK